MFDVAIYTDVRANDAFDGIDGFNFAGTSSGITAQDRTTITNRLVHRVYPAWASGQTDPLTHPPSFGYVKHDNRYLLAMGRSTGTTLNGRPGNVLTQAIATSDEDDFGAMRPAQLFGALNWKVEQVSGKTLEPWATPLEVADDFHTEALRELIVADEWASAVLPRFLTMIEQLTQERPRRLVLVTTDARLAQRWIALGTLFIDAHAARHVTIWGMVDDPLQGVDANIVVASPAFEAHFSASSPHSTVNIVDLDQRTIADIVPSQSSATQASWFLNEDGPTAIAAIELARRWEAFLGSDLATRASAVLSFEHQRLDAGTWELCQRALLGLASSAQSDELFFYGDSLLDAIATHQIKTEAEAALAAETLFALIAADAHDLAAPMLTSTLEAVGERPEVRDAWLQAAAQALGASKLVWENSDEHENAIHTFSALVGDLDAQLAAHLLGIAVCLDVVLLPEAFRGAVLLVADQALTDPQFLTGMSRWPFWSDVVNTVAARLSDAWSAHNAQATDQLTSGAWDWLSAEQTLLPGVASMVRHWLAARDISRLPVARRAAKIEQDELPAQSWRLVWSNAKLPGDKDVYTAWATRQRTVPAAAGQWILRQVQEFLKTGQEGSALREMLGRLGERDITLECRELAQLVDGTRRTHNLCIEAQRCQEVPNPLLQDVARLLQDKPALIMDHVGNLVLKCADRAGVSHVVHASPDWSAASVAYVLQRRRASGDPKIVARSVSYSFRLQDEGWGELYETAQDFLLELVDDTRSREAAQTHLPPEWQDRLIAFAKDAKKGRFRRKVSRGMSVIPNFLTGKGN